MDTTSPQEQPEQKLHFLDYWRIIRIRKTVILSVFLLVAFTTTVVTFFLPQWYSSKVRITVDKDIPDVPGIDVRQAAQAYDPFWLQTEFERIRSTSVLYPVIDNLHLSKEWMRRKHLDGELPKQKVYEMLVKEINVKVTRNTSLIEIEVFSQDKKEAADVAEEIAKSYKQVRDSKRKMEKETGIATLENDLKQKENAVSAAQTNLERMRQEFNIADMGEGMLAQAPTLGVETVRRIEELRIQSHTELVMWQSLFQRLTNMPLGELAKVMPTVLPDTELSELLKNLDYGQQSIAMLQKELGEKSPQYIKAQALIDETQKQVEEKLKGMLVGLETKVEHYQAHYDSIVQDFEMAKTNDIAIYATNRPYYEAKAEVELLKRVRDALRLRVEAERVEAHLPVSSTVDFVDNAEVSEDPVRPNKPLNILLGLVVGMIVGVGLAFFIEYLDTSVKTIDDVEKALQAPVLGVIPQNVGSLLDEGPESPHAEAYRVLRTNMLFSRKNENQKTLTIVSGGAGEGKSTTLFNLATVFAQNGSRVLIVDSDLRRPSIHKIVHVTNSIGLTNFLLKQNTLEEVIQTTKLPTLDVMPSGKLPSSSLGILSSVQMKELVLELKRRYDFVFFDSPPIMGVSDASILASEVDLVLQVIQYRRYPQPMTIRAKQMIQKVGGNLLGIVLNNINMSQDENYYYYSGYYYDYYAKGEYSRHEEEEKPAAATNGQAKTEAKAGARASIKPKF